MKILFVIVVLAILVIVSSQAGPGKKQKNEKKKPLVGGTNVATLSSFPYVVAIRVKKTGVPDKVSTGIALNSKWIIYNIMTTAANAFGIFTISVVSKTVTSLATGTQHTIQTTLNIPSMPPAFGNTFFIVMSLVSPAIVSTIFPTIPTMPMGANTPGTILQWTSPTTVEKMTKTTDTIVQAAYAYPSNVLFSTKGDLNVKVCNPGNFDANSVPFIKTSHILAGFSVATSCDNFGFETFIDLSIYRNDIINVTKLAIVC